MIPSHRAPWHTRESLKLLGRTASRLALLSTVALGTLTAQQSAFYVRAGATGAANGIDWNNAYPTLPSTLARGATYYIADGNYNGYVFDDAVSGTQLITIKKATVADHGTATGWNDTFGDGQATWTGSWRFLTNYWLVDGQVGGGPSDWEGITNPLGFRLLGTCVNIDHDNKVDSGDFVTIRHLEIDGQQTQVGSLCRAVNLRRNHNFTMQHSYIHNIGEDVFSIADGGDNFLLEYSKTKLAPIDQSAASHGDLFEVQYGTMNNWTIRYNFFEDPVGSYLFGAHDTATINGYNIYGNIIYFRTRDQNTGNCQFGHLSAGGTVNNLKVYNNTITGIFGASCFAFYSPWLGTSPEARNNIWHETVDSGYNFSFSSVSHSNNNLYNMVTQAGETNLTGDPFVSEISRDFRLTARTAAGISLPAPYNVDMFGNTRGADGTWDRGAIEYSGVALVPPAQPTNLRLLP